MNSTQMKFFATFWVIVLVFSTTVFAYSKEQLNECILGSKLNPVILGTPQKSIESFCECSLTSIFDKHKDAKSSINQCALKNLG